MAATDKINAINHHREEFLGDSTKMRSVQALLEFASDKDPRVVSAALLAIGYLAKERAPLPRGAIDKVGALMNDSRSVVRRNACRAIGFFGPSASIFIDDLVLRTKESNSDVASFAAESLGLICSEAEKSIPALLHAARKRRPDGRQSMEVEAAIRALSCFGNQMAGYVDEVAALYEADHLALTTKAELLIVIAQISPERAGLISEIKSLYDNDNIIIRFSAIRAIAALPHKNRSEEAIDVVEAACNDPIVGIRELAESLIQEQK